MYFQVTRHQERIKLGVIPFQKQSVTHSTVAQLKPCQKKSGKLKKSCIGNTTIFSHKKEKEKKKGITTYISPSL